MTFAIALSADGERFEGGKRTGDQPDMPKTHGRREGREKTGDDDERDHLTIDRAHLSHFDGKHDEDIEGEDGGPEAKDEKELDYSAKRKSEHQPTIAADPKSASCFASPTL